MKNKVKELRLELGLSQSELADRINYLIGPLGKVNQQYISKIESGEIEVPGLDMSAYISHALQQRNIYEVFEVPFDV